MNKRDSWFCAIRICLRVTVLSYFLIYLVFKMAEAQINATYAGPAPPPYTPHPPPHPPPPVTTTLILTMPVGSEPMITTCPSCRHQIVTRTEKNPSTKTHIIACVLFWFICWPCVCLPYCMNSCNNVEHYCPNCNAYIGGYQY